MEANNHLIYVIYMKDKFGDYGLIGEVIIDIISPEQWFIHDICISCRTMGRGIGAKLLEFVTVLATADGVNNIVAHILPTNVNYRMKQLFEGRGFVYKTTTGEIEVYEWLK